MIAIYNPQRTPQIWGKVTIQGFSYEVVDADVAEAMQSAGVPILKEGDENFPYLFKHCDGSGNDMV